jgi:hypothetical protein
MAVSSRTTLLNATAMVAGKLRAWMHVTSPQGVAEDV